VKARRIAEITIETEEALVIRRASGSVQAMCAQCGREVPMLTPEEAAILFRVAVRSIYREIEGGQLHFQETATGSVVVCLDSLRKAVPEFSSRASSSSSSSSNTSSQIKNKNHKEIQS
jgi:hypothetical protein